MFCVWGLLLLVTLSSWFVGNCCVLFVVVRCLPVVVVLLFKCWLLVVCGLLFAVCCLLLVVCCLLCVVCLSLLLAAVCG